MIINDFYNPAIEALKDYQTYLDKDLEGLPTKDKNLLNCIKYLIEIAFISGHMRGDMRGGSFGERYIKNEQ